MRYAVARQPMKQREERPSSDYPEARQRKAKPTDAKLRAMSLLNGRVAKEEDHVNRRQAESHEFAQWPKREGGRQRQLLASSIASTPSPVFA